MGYTGARWPGSAGRLKPEATLEASIEALLRSAEAGDARAHRDLFAALYDDLHRLARRELGRNGAATLGATTLLHEAYLGLSSRSGPAFPDRARFMAYAAKAMRGLIIDYARKRHALKRGGAFEITLLDTTLGEQLADERELTSIEDAIDALATVEPALAEVVDLKFFCGFSFSEIAAMRACSEKTVQRDWEKARIYLHRALANDQ